ncbi:MAG TPA: GNAT family N-acetyltransferase [Abditibacteriaceae bacterium]
MRLPEITFVDLDETHLPTLEKWFENRELSERLRGMLPLKEFFNFVQTQANYYAWIALEEGQPVGATLVQFNVERSAPQSFAFFVKPQLQSKGYGRRIVRLLVSQPEFLGVQRWQVGIEPDNMASRHCLSAVGFVADRDTPDEDGLLQYVYFKHY